VLQYSGSADDSQHTDFSCGRLHGTMPHAGLPSHDSFRRRPEIPISPEAAAVRAEGKGLLLPPGLLQQQENEVISRILCFAYIHLLRNNLLFMPALLSFKAQSDRAMSLFYQSLKVYQFRFYSQINKRDLGLLTFAYDLYHVG
jgi:hypothetical protein